MTTSSQLRKGATIVNLRQAGQAGQAGQVGGWGAGVGGQEEKVNSAPVSSRAWTTAAALRSRSSSSWTK